MKSPFEMNHLVRGFDSQRIKPDLGDYSDVPEIKNWLGQESDKRFSVKVVLPTIESMIKNFDDLPAEIKEDPYEISKLHFCAYAYQEVWVSGRKSKIYKLLENFKWSALEEVLQNESARSVLNKGRYKPEIIDRLVTRQIFKIFFDSVDSFRNTHEKSTQDPRDNFSLN